MAKKTKKEKLTKDSVVEALVSAKIDEMGKAHNFTVLIEEDSIDIKRDGVAHLRDVFTKRGMTPDEYASFVIELITRNMLY